MTRPNKGRIVSVPSELCLYLNECDNWTRAHRLLPQLSERRLEQARNSRVGTERNNDVLEFVGDRIINLICALVVAKDSFCPDQQVVVGRAVSNNDTLGRLAHQLQLHKPATLDVVVREDVDGWSLQQTRPPPKVLADLFEAYTGAVYEEHGRDVTTGWLVALFTPLIEKATEDYLNLKRQTQMTYLHRDLYVSRDLLANVEHQEKLHDYLEFRADKFMTMAEPALSALPQSTKFVFGANGGIGSDRDRVEIATHLVKFWICEIFMALYPENREALLKGPHLISSITVLVTNAWTLGYLGSVLQLGSFFDVEDTDYSLFDKRLTSPRSITVVNRQRELSLRSKLAQALYAVIGWYHFANTKAARKWGIKWLTPLVTRAHDIVMEDPSFKPCLPHGANDTLAIHAAALAAIQKSQDIIPVSKEDELEARFAAMVIKGKETRHNTPDSGAFASHRLTIELDDDSESERDHNGTFSVEELIPTLHNLKIHSPQQSQNDNPDMMKTRGKTIKIGLCNDDTRRFENDDRTKRWAPQVESSSAHSLLDTTALASKPALLDEATDTSKLKAHSISESSTVVTQVSGTHTLERKPHSEEGSLEERITKNKSNVVTSAARAQPGSREPPREPRAMREQRNREQQRLAALKGQLQLKVDEDPKRLRLEGKENSHRFRSGRSNCDLGIDGSASAREETAYALATLTVSSGYLHKTYKQFDNIATTI